MTKELDYGKLKRELINLLEKYLKNPKDKKIQDKLSELWKHYFNTFPFMKEEIGDALGIGEDFLCYTEPSKERVKQIIEKLKSAKF